MLCQTQLYDLVVELYIITYKLILKSDIRENIRLYNKNLININIIE